MSVGVMKDYKLKQRNLRASHTRNGGSPIFFFSRLEPLRGSKPTHSLLWFTKRTTD